MKKNIWNAETHLANVNKIHIRNKVSHCDKNLQAKNTGTNKVLPNRKHQKLLVELLINFIVQNMQPFRL